MLWRWLGGALLFAGAIAAFTVAWMVAVTLVAVVLVVALVVFAFSPKARRSATFSFSVSSKPRRGGAVIEGEARRVDEPPVPLPPLTSEQTRLVDDKESDPGSRKGS